MGEQIEHVGVRYSISEQEIVDEQLRQFEEKTDRINRKLDQAQTKATKGVLSRFARTAAKRFSTAAIAYTASEFLAEVAERQSGSAVVGFITAVGSAAATGFAFGNFAGSAVAATAVAISELYQLHKKAETEQLSFERRIEKESRDAQRLFQQDRLRRDQVAQKLANELKEIRSQISDEALEIAFLTWRHK